MLGLPILAVLMSSLGGAQIKPPPSPDMRCLYPAGRGNFTAFSTEIFRQGATIGIRPQRDTIEVGYGDLPADCLGDWSIEGPADLSDDRRTLTIRPDAPPGSEIVLRYTVRGEPVLARFRVIARDAVVLNGTWGQSAAAGCEALEPVRELQFGPDSFSVTFTPFESYKDYWGTYRFDPATGALRLTVEQGNNIPPGLDLEGTARIEDGHLVLDGMFLGDRNGRVPEQGCRYSF